MGNIENQDLLDLIHWARRYCDGRETYAPSSFNLIYKKLKALNPDTFKADMFDQTLMHEGAYWPFAQDGMYDPIGNVGWDAPPKSYLNNDRV